ERADALLATLALDRDRAAAPTVGAFFALPAVADRRETAGRVHGADQERGAERGPAVDHVHVLHHGEHGGPGTVRVLHRDHHVRDVVLVCLRHDRGTGEGARNSLRRVEARVVAAERAHLACCRLYALHERGAIL